MMNLYLLTNNTNKNHYTFDSCIVAADSEEEARDIHPNQAWDDEEDYNPWEYNNVWCEKEDVVVSIIGKPINGQKKGVVLASFNTEYY